MLPGLPINSHDQDVILVTEPRREVVEVTADDELVLHIVEPVAAPQGGGVGSSADITAAITAHRADPDAHPGYATDSEVAAALATKVGATALAPVAFSGDADDLDGTLPPSVLPVLTGADVGLDQVDNTADLDKPVSTATQTAVTEAIVGHVAETDPHPQYLTVAEAGVLIDDAVADLPAPSGGMGLYPPSAAGFKLWTIDPLLLTGDYQLHAGLLLMQRVLFPRAETITSLCCAITATGATPNGGMNGMALYGAAGQLLSASADLPDRFTTGAAGAVRDFPLAVSQAVQADTYGWLALLANCATAPRNAAPPASNQPGAAVTVNTGSRRLVYTSGNTAFPATVNIATATLNNGMYWMGAR